MCRHIRSKNHKGAYYYLLFCATETFTTRIMEYNVTMWTNQEVQALIRFWGDEAIQRELESAVRNEKVYQKISQRLAEMGIQHTAKQCREKIKKMKQDYRKIKSQDWRGKAKPKWFDSLDAVLSTRPAAAGGPSSGLDSTCLLLQSMLEDSETSFVATQDSMEATRLTAGSFRASASFANTGSFTSGSVTDMEEEVSTQRQRRLKDSSTITDSPGSCSNTFIPSTMLSQTPYPIGNPQDPDFYCVQLEDVDGPSTSTSVTSTAVQTSSKDTSLCCWSNKEVQALLTFWANPSVQEELLLNVRNSKVYAHLSAKLASLGFNKAPKKCREKVKKLKQEYKKFKNGQYRGGWNSSNTNVWFAIMDNVLSSQAATTKHLRTTEPSPPRLSQSVLDMDTNCLTDESQWLPDEIQVLMTLWAQPNIQQQLLTTAANDEVFTYLSNELALVGFNKTPHQCNVKVNHLKEEYKRIKEVDPYWEVKGDWFSILDGVLGAGGEASAEVDSSAVLTQPKSHKDEHVNDTLHAVWTSDEVKVLLTRWAEDNIQEELRSSQRNERVFAQLSSELATQGFDKTTSQCRSKIRQLKQRYKMIKELKGSKKQKNRWFVIMDKVLGHRKPETKQAAAAMDLAPKSLRRSQLGHPETGQDSGCHLSLSSLCLLVPTLRLMSAFAWQVVQCCNVLHYGKVEELVRQLTELAPELLTSRDKVQLLLRLRARLVLELCRSENTANLQNIQPHLKVIQDLTICSTCNQEVSLQELEELENSKSNFVDIVHTLLEDPEERERFFKEVFPLHYGQQYQATLHTLVWKFISRLDTLLPIPDIKQTAEWLSTAPILMEECGQLVLEPGHLKALMHFHHQHSKNTNECYSRSQNMFLPRLFFSPKANFKQLASEQQEESTDDEEGGLFDNSEDEEPDEEDQSEDEPTLEDCNKQCEDLKLEDEQSDDLTAANCSNLNNSTHLRPHTCALCPYSDSLVSGLLQHIRDEHLVWEPSHLPSKEPGKDDDLQYGNSEMCTSDRRSTANTCEYCGKVFKYVSSLNCHLNTHTLPFRCDACPKKYSTKEALDVHRRIHTGEKPYLCSHCGRGFRSPYTLGFHVRIHTGDCRYKCNICGKTSIQHLNRHMRMHRGEKNYLCTECGKAFLSSQELRLHMRFHTGERPYTCRYCGRGFIAKCLLTVHMRQHTGESPYRCSMCPKAFHTLRAQKKHMTIHLNKKSFQCLKCGKIFRQQDNFKVHVQTHK
uniref:uncharacterized protein LOC109959892 isoform X2 n=1 Tax=Monopterus albus TaxID=43700 RepID=UPI0009B369A7|nr:uncharacterized protein LOC109959892 isoform X2 [Monopterus albus]